MKLTTFFLVFAIGVALTAAVLWPRHISKAERGVRALHEGFCFVHPYSPSCLF